MKVKVTWINNNPFVPDLRNLCRYSEAELPNDTKFETIEEFAREAAPERFHLHLIDIEGKVTKYDYHGSKIQ